MKLSEGWKWTRGGTEEGEEEELIKERNWSRDGTDQKVKRIKVCNWSRGVIHKEENWPRRGNFSRWNKTMWRTYQGAWSRILINALDQGMKLIQGGTDQGLKLIKKQTTITLPQCLLNIIPVGVLMSEYSVFPVYSNFHRKSSNYLHLGKCT